MKINKQKILDLHEYKGKQYGNSWCKRGEVFSILPNIHRKSDRLEIVMNTLESNEGDLKSITQVESIEDTIVDLEVYLLKYFTFLNSGKVEGEGHNNLVAEYLHHLPDEIEGLTPSLTDNIKGIVEEVDILSQAVLDKKRSYKLLILNLIHLTWETLLTYEKMALKEGLETEFIEK